MVRRVVSKLGARDKSLVQKGQKNIFLFELFFSTNFIVLYVKLLSAISTRLAS